MQVFLAVLVVLRASWQQLIKWICVE